MTWTKTAALTTTVAVVACHRGMVDEPTGSSDSSTTSVTSAETEDTGSAAAASTATGSTSSDAFDIMEWVGDYHEPPPFAVLGVDWSPGPESEYFRNLYLRDDHTATLTDEPCASSFPTNTYHYRIEPVDRSSVALVPTDPSMDPWLYVTMRLGVDCNALSWEGATGTPDQPQMRVIEFHRGAACWMDTCEPPDYRVYPDYCSGEPPPECP